MILKSDGELAIVKLMEEIKKLRKHNTILQYPPAYDPQANGGAEKAVQDMMGFIKAQKIGLEKRIKVRIETKEPIMQWIIENAPVIQNRCLIGKDGKTAYRRLMGRNTTRTIVGIGESMLAKPLRAQESRIESEV